jgi:beta-lactamase regulating signal transducer with metallopeptidase domain
MTSELMHGLLAVNLALSAAILVAAALRGPVRRRFGARMAYGLWLAAPLAALAVFVPRPHWLPAGLFPPAAPETVMTVQASAAAAAQPASVIVAPPYMLETLWLAGAAVAIILTLLAHRRGMASFGGLSAVGRQGVVRAERTGLGPAMVGVWRPRLVLPADFETRFSDREQTLILAHEKHHQQSGDTRINGLVSLVCCLNWFNPLVHLAAHLLRVDQELACDAAVVERFPGERRTYAEALLKSQLISAPLPLGCTWPSGSPTLLQERLTMLAFKSLGRSGLVAGGALVGALCLGTAVAAWAASGAPDTASQVAVDAMTAAPMQRVVVDSVPAAPAVRTVSAKRAASGSTNSPTAAPATVENVVGADAAPPAAVGYVCLSNGCADQSTASSITSQSPANGMAEQAGANSLRAAIDVANQTGGPVQVEVVKGQNLTFYPRGLVRVKGAAELNEIVVTGRSTE